MSRLRRRQHRADSHGIARDQEVRPEVRHEVKQVQPMRLREDTEHTETPYLHYPAPGPNFPPVELVVPGKKEKKKREE